VEDSDSEDSKATLKTLLLHESYFFPWKKWLFIVGTWLVVALYYMSISLPFSGVGCGTGLYYGLEALLIPLLFGVAAGVGWFLYRLYKLRAKLHYPYVQGDPKWTVKRYLLFSGVSLCTGVLAAMFGLGGGTLNSPALIELGILPAVIPATSGLIIFITSSMAIIQYAVLGKAPWQYMVWFGVVGLIGGLSGHLGIRYYIKRYKKQTLIVFLLGTLVFVGMCTLLYVLVASFIAHTAQMTLLSPCGT